MLKIKVRNMTSNSGNSIANQFVITTDEGQYFQSYDSVIAFIPAGVWQHGQVMGEILLDANTWDYSKTTGKYRNQFLNETKKETQARIDSGEYKLVNLN